MTTDVRIVARNKDGALATGIARVSEWSRVDPRDKGGEFLPCDVVDLMLIEDGYSFRYIPPTRKFMDDYLRWRDSWWGKLNRFMLSLD